MKKFNYIKTYNPELIAYRKAHPNAKKRQIQKHLEKLIQHDKKQ